MPKMRRDLFVRRVRLLPLLVLLFLCANGLASQTTNPPTIDLSRWSFEEEGIATLDGEWAFYWQELLEPSDFPVNPAENEEAPAMFYIPDIWNDHSVDGETLGGIGYATFRTTVLLPSGMRRGALRVPNASTAYRMWVNGALLSQSGEPGPSRAETVPRYRIRTVDFSAPTRSLDIVLQVANFHHRRGGMWKPIEIGTNDQIESKEAVEAAYDLLLIGSFFAMALYNILLYSGSERKHKGMLFLGLLFAVLTVRISVMGQMIVTRLVPEFPWGLQLRIEYVTAMLALFAITETLHAIYPSIIRRALRLTVAVFVAANALLIFTGPVLLYSRIVQPLVYTMIAFLLLESVLLLVALIRGRKHAAVGLGAAAITFLITLGETIHYQQVILSRDFAPLGFLITLIAGDSVNQTTAYLVSTGANLILVFFIANLLAVKGSRTLHAVYSIEEPQATILSNGRAGPLASEHLRQVLKYRFGLTKREAEVIERLADGQTNKEIAAQLFVSEATIKTHVHRILHKCRCGNRTEVGRLYFALQAGASDTDEDEEATQAES
jgi:DNA-binding CsgD family transcriptional regulator